MLVYASGYMKTMHVEVFISAAFVFKIYVLMNEMTRLLILVYELLRMSNGIQHAGVVMFYVTT